MAVGSYATTTLTQAIQSLGNRLMDPSFVRWTSAELTVYIQQALRTWNALTGFYRTGGSFSTTATEPFYDLPTVLPSLRAQTYTLQDAVEEVCHHLLEPVPVAGAWVGTGQFTLPQVVEAVGAARDQFLRESLTVLTRSQLTVDPVPSDGEVDLDEAIINLRRLSWRTANGIQTILRRADEWGFTNFAPVTWVTQAAQRPIAYSVGVTPPLVLQIAPVPSAAATLDLVTINRGPTVDYSASQTLGVPNDWAWVVIFKALVELLNKDGIAYDPSRAAYCEARWKHGVAQAKQAAVVLAARIDGAPVNLGSLSGADAYDPGWQMVPAVPKRILQAGHTLVACWPPPGVPVGGGSFTVLLDVIQNAPVPTAGGDFLQIGPELLDTILDYAQHLALFKEGVAQIQQAETLLTNFLESAGTEIEIQWASQPNREQLLGQTTRDPKVVAFEISNRGTIN